MLDISEVRVEGLETLDYFDNLLQKEWFIEQVNAITFDNGGREAFNWLYEHLKVLDAVTAENQAAEILFGLGFDGHSLPHITTPSTSSERNK